MCLFQAALDIPSRQPLLRHRLSSRFALHGLRAFEQTFLFSQTFRALPAKSREIPPKEFGFPGFEGHTDLFGPHPFTWKTPTPRENIRTQKFGSGFFFRA